MRTRRLHSITLAAVTGLAIVSVAATSQAHGSHGGGSHLAGVHSTSGGAHIGVTGHLGGYIVGVHVGDGFPPDESTLTRAPRDTGGYLGDGRHGGAYGGYLYVGPESEWSRGAHWGRGFWASEADGWAWYTGPWWVSPEYPGWVWMGRPWVWDGAQWLSQDGYWTTAGLPADTEPPGFVDASGE
jgi:hypothetical protein